MFRIVLRRRFIAVTLALLSALPHASHALEPDADPLILTSAPTHSVEVTRQVYAPLVQFVEQVLGRPVELLATHNYIEYQVKMRLDKFDLAFDGPHLAAWRMVNQAHRPLVRLPGQVRIAVVTGKESPYQQIEELRAVRVCAFASPNLLTMAFLREFPNPARQPFLIRAQGFKGLTECLSAGRGEAAVIRDTMWEKMDQAGLRQLPVGDYHYPERTLTASPRLSDAEQAKLRTALLSAEGQAAMQPILTLFKKDVMVGADAGEYAGLDQLMTPIWGFHSQAR